MSEPTQQEIERAKQRAQYLAGQSIPSWVTPRDRREAERTIELARVLLALLAEREANVNSLAISDRAYRGLMEAILGPASGGPARPAMGTSG